MPSLPATPFAGDPGDADRVLSEKLEAYGLGQVSDAEVVRALCGTRVLVPIVATPTSVVINEHGAKQEKSTDMEVVLWKRPTDGRVALLAFTSLQSMQLWSLEARPSPVTVTDAARVARAESATALLVDVAGPVRFVVENDDLVHLATGHALVAAGAGHAWVKPSREHSSV
jgi:hypothetical protein